LTFGELFDVLRLLSAPENLPGKRAGGRGGDLTPKPGAEIVRRNLLRPATNILGLPFEFWDLGAG